MRAFVRSALVCSSLLAGALAFGPPTARAGDDVSRGGLEPGAVETVLGRQGYSDIRNVRRKGALWLAEASSPRGQRVRTVVDAFTGEITGLAPVQGGADPGARKSADARL
ncbi:hypothetical protein GCM10007036_40910 [Alsobacter metallidurans]|uniref:PepSY domain-containing protein n=1 Tax=Alsobacter metallidurans TaxID=340221 RepID=A0A917IBN6_9HYPH|nr:hypothetical protein [Alsobacter metallidurans]GGH30368.1 hypothetical protein GCM10007036_40910 [Alsobacter metallidurans]